MVSLPSTRGAARRADLLAPDPKINPEQGMKWGIAPLLLSIGGFIPSVADASVLYGAGYSTKTLYRLSQTTAAATPIGVMPQLRDLGSDTRPDSFRLWGTAFSRQLYRLNPATGMGTLVGTFVLPTSTDEIRTLAFDTVSEKLYGTSDVDSNLYEINPNTAALTLIGHVGLSQLGGMGADAAGNLYGIKEDTGGIYLIDELTATPTLVSTVPVTYMSDLAFRPEDGALFGITHVGPVETYRSLYTIDLPTGNVTRLGYTSQTETTMAGLAFGPAVPEPASGMGTICAAILLLRRRR